MKSSILSISLLTISGLYFLLAGFIIFLVLLMGGNVLFAVGLSIIVLIIQFLISPFVTDLTMKWFYKAKFDIELPEYLKNYVQAVCTKENMKYPKFGYIEDGAPNCFTYGHTKNNARIILTQGIFNILTPEEVMTVVGHELGHAVHYDMLFMTVAQLVPLVLYHLYRLFKETTTRRRNNKNGSGGAILMLITYILYVITNYIVLWLSRTREYYADSYAIESTGNPNGLASALVKIGYGLTTASSNTQRSTSGMNALGIFDAKSSKSLVVTSYDNGTISREYIKNAMKWEQWNVWAKWFEFNSTHPLISKRLLAISKRSPEYNQEPFITFDLQKPESYVDDFLIECLINFAPSFFLIVGLMLWILLTVLDHPRESALSLPAAIFIATLCSLIKFFHKRPGNGYTTRTVRDLLGEVKVSEITAIPCELEGTIIGRGDPGNVFNEDMILQDQTGIIFLDYKQPIFIMNIIFGLFQNKKMAGKVVKVRGWYRRSPVPYVEIKTYEVDGIKKTIFTYPVAIILYSILIFIEIIALLIISLG